MCFVLNQCFSENQCDVKCHEVYTAPLLVREKTQPRRDFFLINQPGVEGTLIFCDTKVRGLNVVTPLVIMREELSDTNSTASTRSDSDISDNGDTLNTRAPGAGQ